MPPASDVKKNTHCIKEYQKPSSRTMQKRIYVCCNLRQAELLGLKQFEYMVRANHTPAELEEAAPPLALLASHDPMELQLDAHLFASGNTGAVGMQAAACGRFQPSIGW